MAFHARRGRSALHGVATKPTLTLKLGDQTNVMEFDLLTGEQSWQGDPPVEEYATRRFFDGPFSAPPVSGPATPAVALVAAVPALGMVLAEDDPPVPAVGDWSYHAGEPLDEFRRFSHWVDWNEADQLLVAAAINATPETTELIVELIDTWTWTWPDVAAQTIPIRLPELALRLLEAHDGDPRFGRKRETHRANWLDTAMHEGLFEHYRHVHPWPDPQAQVCGTCGRLFAPETLSHWMRQFGPARYCAGCCCRARNGRPQATNDEIRAAVRAVSEALGFIPPQNVAQRADLAALPNESRDRSMAALICLPRPDVCADALGIPSGRGPWLAVLQGAGVVDDGWRPARGTLCRAVDGHACRSLGERSIDDFFTANHIAHEVEPAWPAHPTFNPTGKLRADWLLADGTFVEYAGMLENEDYAEKMARKTEMAAALGLPLVIVTPADLTALPNLFG